MLCNADAQTARARAEVIDRGGRHLLQKLNGRLADNLAVGAGAEHAAAHLERKVHKVPLAQQILQRLAGGAALGQNGQTRGLGGGGAIVQPRVAAGGKLIKLRRVKAGIGYTGHHQPGAKILIGSIHQRASS